MMAKSRQHVSGKIHRIHILVQIRARVLLIARSWFSPRRLLPRSRAGLFAGGATSVVNMGLGFEELDSFAMLANHFIYEFAIEVRAVKLCQSISTALLSRVELSVNTP